MNPSVTRIAARRNSAAPSRFMRRPFPTCIGSCTRSTSLETRSSSSSCCRARTRDRWSCPCANWQDPAIIEANYLETDQDRRAIVGAINAARELGHQQAFNEVRDVELIPGPQATAQDVEDLARTGSADRKSVV